MKYADFDYSKYPFVYVKINPKHPTVDELQQFFGGFKKLFTMPGKAIVIYNTRDLKLLSSEARIETGKWLKSIEPDLKEKVQCVFCIESSIWLQMLVKGIFLVTKPPIPLHVVDNQDDVARMCKKEYGVEMTVRF